MVEFPGKMDVDAFETASGGDGFNLMTSGLVQFLRCSEISGNSPRKRLNSMVKKNV
jgi:hypothetical protein